MVGSSASDGGAGLLSGGLAGGGGGGIAASTLGSTFGGAGGGGGAGAATWGAGAGAGVGAGAAIGGGGGLDGRGPEPPGMKEKSSASDEEIHGTCSLREARVTPTRVRFSVSSAVRSGTRISLRSSCTNRLRSRPVSDTTDDSAAEYMTNVPLGAITGASPADAVRKRRS